VGVAIGDTGKYDGDTHPDATAATTITRKILQSCHTRLISHSDLRTVCIKWLHLLSWSHDDRQIEDACCRLHFTVLCVAGRRLPTHVQLDFLVILTTNELLWLAFGIS
jgi:hypothetical protein